MKNKLFLCFRPLDVAEDSLILKHDVDHHSSSRKKYHKENPTLKTKGKRRRSSRKDKTISKASSSSSELSYSTSSLSSTTSSSSDLSRSNSNSNSISSISSYEQKEAKYGSAECDNLLVMNLSSFCLYFFVFVLFLLIYMGKVSSIVVTSVGLIVFSLVERWKLENPPMQFPEMK
uniref:Probable serine/threonine-protein kinase roco8 n=2 Tax=Nicotiana TaxID=4085 RepID=A0A1S3YUF8_TOBAC|nr:PREDICTED: probable serine/threonine-protein kinase roco8 [Nicotiana sylvestris]XP_016455758.1 PREDICTED: probable serine/threonine-protein kinase roco8 [Nicotiana tabacum]